MFRAEIRWLASGPTLKMKGRLVRHWAVQARSLVTKDIIPEGLIVDLSDVTYIDSAGEDLLKWLGGIGAQFAADSTYAVNVCERLDLPILESMTARRSSCVETRASRPHDCFP